MRIKAKKQCGHKQTKWKKNSARMATISDKIHFGCYIHYLTSKMCFSQSIIIIWLINGNNIKKTTKYIYNGQTKFEEKLESIINV